MRKIFTLMISAMFVAGVFAQRPEGVIMKASTPPVIDEKVDEVWAEANVYPIDQPFQAEVPTVEGTTWKALWDEAGIYVLVECKDDAWLPMYLDEPAGVNNWEYDKPEIYFDVNFNLTDGGGASAANGHYQVAPGPTLDQNDGRALTTGFQGGAADATYSITVNAPDANYEYFIPMEALTNGDGLDVQGTIGFDVTMIDRDPGDAARKRAVWANVGAVDESWNNMDDAGWVTFDGAEIGVYVESVSVEDAVIDENNGTVQLIATVLPENADKKDVKWSITGGTGRASISKSGVVTGMMDGTVTINAIATDGSYAEDNCTVTISNQIVTIGEINLFRNGFFNQVNADGTAAEWTGSFQVVNGELYIPAPANTANWWEGGAISGQAGFGLNTTDTYTFSFVLRSEAPDTFYVDFEDPANGYNRFGTSTNAYSTGLSDASTDNQSQWEFVTTEEPMYYLIDEALVFNEWLANTNEQFNLMGGKHDAGGVYIDSLILINNNDKDLLTPGYIPVKEVVVSGDATVAVDGTIELDAAVSPGNATLTDVRWSVVNGTGEATIDASGMLTGVAAGVVTVVASAKDDSGVTGVMDVTVGSSVGIAPRSVETLRVYPNPAVNELNVVLNAENTSVSIYNAVGQRMEQVVVSGTEYKFDISSYAAGIYFVKTGTSIAKFVK
jgi:hypothetical protein